MHGGTGFTWEHDAHLYWRRAKVDRLLLGDAAEHHDVVAGLVLAGRCRERRAGSGTGLYAVDGGVRDPDPRPADRRNAYTPVMARELAEVAAVADADDAVRVVVVTGAGRDFCVGADLSGRHLRPQRAGRRGGTIDGVPATGAASGRCRSPRCASP